MKNGKCITEQDGNKFWYFNGERHRDDGPAIEYQNGSKMWWVNGKCHRVDGPAVEFSNGDKFWYLYSKYYSEKDFKIKINQMVLNKDLFVL